MKFIKGFTIGALVGFAIGAATSESQRRAATDRITTIARRRAQPVTDAVTGNVAQVADATADVAATAVDDAGDAVVERIEAAAPQP